MLDRFVAIYPAAPCGRQYSGARIPMAPPFLWRSLSSSNHECRYELVFGEVTWPTPIITPPTAKRHARADNAPLAQSIPMSIPFDGAILSRPHQHRQKHPGRRHRNSRQGTLLIAGAVHRLGQHQRHLLGVNLEGAGIALNRLAAVQAVLQVAPRRCRRLHPALPG